MNRKPALLAPVVMCLTVFVAFGQAQQSSKVVATGTSDIEPATGAEVLSGNSAAGSGSQAIVPRLMKFSGVLRDAKGNPLSGAVDVTFTLYNVEAGGSPLWYETQSVQADELGRYTALLGAMHAGGLPVDLFTSGEVRWLGIQIGMEQEQQPRVLMVSVPYALKAGDAETLGGKPASAFMLANSTGAADSTAVASTSSSSPSSTGGKAQTAHTTKNSPLTACSSLTSDGTAVNNSIALFTTACNLESSVISQLSGNVGIGTSSPAAKLHVQNGNIRIVNGGSYPLIIDQSLGSIFTITNGVGKQLAFDYNGNLGIGTLPAHRLDVAGEINANMSGNATAITGIYSGTVYDAVDGIATASTGTTAGVYGASASNAGVGLYGYAGSASGTTYGVYGQAVSTNGVGVYGQGGQWAGYFSGDVYSNGHVGIGTTTPSANLEVNGTAKFDGAVTFVAAQSFPHVGVFNATTLFNNLPSVNPAYVRIDGTSSAFGTEAYRASVMPTACTAGNLTVVLSAPANLTVALRDNGISTALACTISGSTACTDSVHSVAISPGNLISLQLTGGSTGGLVYTAFTCN